MRERGILISTTGPAGNVLKIRPPLVFQREHADLLLQTLDEVLDVLDSLRDRLGCSISLRGNKLTLDGEGERVAEARAVVDELVELVEGGHAIGPDTVGAVAASERRNP